MKAIVTVIGKDRVGITAAVCALLAQHSINILDISQTVLQDYFTMVMLVDTAACTARAEVTAYGSTVQLHLHGADLRSLAAPADEAALRKALEADLQTSFAVLTKATAASDLFHFGFWQQCVYGPNAAPKTPTLQILWE